ncbi:MAG: helix-turn-helix domain-containing protein [Pseudodesulfovibrio sp.]|uniref:AraC family ligand binding domain-containing protein n=1 Tax=Pseudodesulfovibrio sp. TaxID=2035812 RepID=UPI003D0C436F
MGKQPTNAEVRFWRDPDLPGVEVRRSSYHEEAFRTHVHAEYSIGFIETGRTTFELDGIPHAAATGQLVFIGPNQAHACNPDLGSGMTYRMFYIDPKWLIAMAGEVFGTGHEPPRFPAPVVDDRQLADILLALYQAIAEGADRLEKESLLVQMLADALTRHAEPGRPTEPSGGEETVEIIKTYLADNLAEKVSLDDLARAANLSRYHLLRVFQAGAGLPPHAYQNQLRVDLGRQLLAKGHPVSEVALEAGFADQSHFTRVFRKYTGATPRQYRDSGRS